MFFFSHCTAVQAEACSGCEVISLFGKRTMYICIYINYSLYIIYKFTQPMFPFMFPLNRKHYNKDPSEHISE